MTEEDRKKKLEIQDLWIDIGVKDKEEAQSLVRVGDPITYAESFEIVRGPVVASRAFDDKAGSFAVGEVLRLLAGKTFDAAVYAVSTVQEEVGLRGARTSAYGIDPKVGVAVDVCHANRPSRHGSQAGRRHQARRRPGHRALGRTSARSWSAC